MFKLILILIGLLYLLQPNVFALQVTPDSSCAALCLNNPESNHSDPTKSFTTASEISCNDGDYKSSSAGIKFKNCLDCLQDSRDTSGEEYDTAWLLYNIRYSVDVCVYGYPNKSDAISSPCDIDFACEPLKKALTNDELDPKQANTFGYCDADGGKFISSQVDACIQCFSSSSSQAYMANFYTALKAGCEQRPKPGALLGLTGSLFSESTINITAPPVNLTLTAKDDDNSTTMTTGAIVGIAVGAALLFFGGTGLFWVYHRKQKRMYANYGSDFDPRAGSKSISPPLQGRFASLDSRQASAMSDYELKAQRGYTNNAQYYDSIEKEMQTRKHNYAFDPHNPGSGSVLPTHHAYLPRAVSRNSSRDVSPQPPIRKSNKPDSYALQAYLHAAEDAEALRLPGPPPGPPPAAHSRDSSLSRPPIHYHSRSSSASSHRPPPPQPPALPTQLSPPPPPPPPPPRQSKVPSLMLPSVPRIRIPKKYSPPKIHVEEATPLSTQGEVQIGMEISSPVPGNPFELRGQSSTSQPDRIVEQSALDRRRRGGYEEVALGTGKSALYG